MINLLTFKDASGRIVFKKEELACKATGHLKLAVGFAEKLIQIREAFGQPMPVTSCCRSKDYNTKVGGSPRSFHVYDEPYWPTGGCAAIDITKISPVYGKDLVKLALDLGWSVGVGKTFIHLDRRVDYTDLPQTLFTY